MKTIQLFLFFLAFLFVGSLVEAQSSIVYVNKGFLGEERMKVVFADAEASMCEASFYWKDVFDEDFQKMKTKSCSDLGNNSYDLKLASASGKNYKAKYSNDGGLVMTYDNGVETVFGYEFVLTSGANKFTMIIAGANSYFAFTVPKKDLNEEVFVLSSKAAGKRFSKEFQEFAFGDNNSIEFEIERELNLGDGDGKGKIKMTRPDEDSFIIEFIENGKSTFFTAK
jgi:hypothetical protein